MENSKKSKKNFIKKEVLTRINIIKEILDRFKIINKLNDYDEEIISNHENKKEYEIQVINDYFKDLRSNEIAYILYSFSLSDERKIDNIIIF